VPTLLRSLAGLPWALARRDVLPPRVHRMHRRVFGVPRRPASRARLRAHG